jgi:hypothetical protein
MGCIFSAASINDFKPLSEHINNQEINPIIIIDDKDDKDNNKNNPALLLTQMIYSLRLCHEQCQDNKSAMR